MKKLHLKLIPLEERIVLDAAAAAVIYVNSHAALGGDGSSWAHAFNNLQDALTKAASTPGPDQIWIAKGTYTPSQIYAPLDAHGNPVLGGASGVAGNPIASNMKTFNLPDNVSLYGGFVGNETSRSQAKPKLNPTILSGDLMGNDINNTSDPGYLASKADNAWHVLTAGNDVTQTGVTALLQGITITNGFAAGPEPVAPPIGTEFPTYAYSWEEGGGLYARFTSQITLNNDTLTNNAAGYYHQPVIDFFPQPGGGAIFAMDPGTKLNIDSSQFTNNTIDPTTLHNGGAIETYLGVSLNLTNSLLTGNKATRYGGAILMAMAGASTISHDIFRDNSLSDPTVFVPGFPTETFGGAIMILNTAPGAIVTIDSSLFQNNSDSGGVQNFAGAIGIATDGNFNPGFVNVVISKSTFIHNSSDIGGAITAILENVVSSPSFISIVNDNFIGNTANAQGGAVEIDDLNGLIDHCNFIGNSSAWNAGALENSDFLATVLNFFGVPSPYTTLTVTNTNFIGNSVNATTDGFNIISGAFGAQGFPLIPTSAGGVAGGGAIRNDLGANLVLGKDSYVNNNVTNGDGGAILNVNPTAYFISSAINSPSSITVDHSSFVNNSATGNGGAIASVDNISLTPLISATITNDSFVANRAQNGGALYLKTTNATVSGNSFANSDNADLLGDQIYGAHSLVNGISTSSTAALIANLTSNNIFKHLVNDDIYLL